MKDSVNTSDMTEVNQDRSAELIAKLLTQDEVLQSAVGQEIQTLMDEEDALRRELAEWKTAYAASPTELECYKKNTIPIELRLVEIEQKKRALRGDSLTEFDSEVCVALVEPKSHLAVQRLRKAQETTVADDAKPSAVTVRKSRSDLLGPLIDKAVHRAGWDTAAVFCLLREWASQDMPPQPLRGVTDKGIQWMNSNDEPNELNRGSLDRRLKRRREPPRTATNRHEPPRTAVR